LTEIGGRNNYMHGERIYFSDQNLNLPPNAENTNTHFQNTFKNFLNDFSRDNTREYYRQLNTQIQKKKYLITIELSDLKAFD